MARPGNSAPLRDSRSRTRPDSTGGFRLCLRSSRRGRVRLDGRRWDAGCARSEVAITQTGSPPITTFRPVGKAKPIPRTARQALRRVRAAADTSRAASPFTHELAWAAQWRGDKWWLVGLFDSEWGTKFVVDATLRRGTVYTYINYLDRPTSSWVRTTARRLWHVSTFYTRFTSAAAISVAQRSAISTSRYSVIDAAAKLARDTAKEVGWYFAFYVQDTASGNRIVVVVTRFGDGYPVEEGEYSGGYGFGSQPGLSTSVPLNLSDWVHTVAAARGWTPSNLP
jgi:hypothetical protein